MTCRDIEPLLLAESDGDLPPAQQARLTEHVATCPACRESRERLRQALSELRAENAAVKIPDASAAWRELQASLSAKPQRPTKQRPLAPIIWFGSSLAAAAAVALAFLGDFSTTTPSRQTEQTATIATTRSAEASYVEAGDRSATTMVYADQESGWLVVWASAGETDNKG